MIIGHAKTQSGVNLVQGGWFSWWSQRERRKRTKVKGKKNPNILT